MPEKVCLVRSTLLIIRPKNIGGAGFIFRGSEASATEEEESNAEGAKTPHQKETSAGTTPPLAQLKPTTRSAVAVVVIVIGNVVVDLNCGKALLIHLAVGCCGGFGGFFL